jgi:hypothetical protein
VRAGGWAPVGACRGRTAKGRLAGGGAEIRRVGVAKGVHYDERYMAPAAMNAVDTRALYLDLLKKVLVDYFWIGPQDGTIFNALTGTPPDLAGRFAVREVGLDWPQRAFSMSGLARLDNLQFCIETAVSENVPGDIVEAGVWRGGAGILARGVLQSLGVSDRTVWLADSFAGLPAPDVERYPHDRNLDLSQVEYLRAGLDEVRETFRRFGFLDDRVRFVAGWFRDTLPSIEVETIAVARLDADLYESMTLALEHLYPKMSPGGYVIVDDYFFLPNCHDAVDDFRRRNAIDAPIQQVDWSGGFWRVPL